MSRRYWPLLLAAALLWFGTLGIRPLYKADESRYGEISREMVASGDWVTPRLNGFKYFEKPPLQYWTTAAFFEVLGVKDWVARLWAALTGFAGVLLVLHAGNRLFGAPAGAYAAAILAGSPLYVLLGQVNTLDMGVTFFLTAAIVAFAMGRMLWFWAACAAAVLSKGLIGIVLPAAAIGLYILVRWDWGLLRRMRLLMGPALFLLITAPWFVAVSLANGEFLHFFFIQEHFQRFTTQMHHRVQPAWYFIPVLFAGMAPWLLPALRGLRIRRAPGFDPALFLLLWALVVFVFFSASGSKLPPYILPVVPALALLAGRAFATAPRWLMMLQAALLLVAGAAAALLIPLRAGATYADYAQWLTIAGITLAIAGAFAAVLAWRGRIPAAVLALSAGGLLATQVGIAGHRTMSDRFSVASVVAASPELPPSDVPVFAVDMYDHTLPWSLRRTVTMVGHRDELEVAIRWEPQKFLPSLDAFAQAWKQAPRAWAFVPVEEADALSAKLGIQMDVLARGPQYAIVKKP